MLNGVNFLCKCLQCEIPKQKLGINVSASFMLEQEHPVSAEVQGISTTIPLRCLATSAVEELMEY